MTQHSKLGASSASRWLNCPGSVKLSETVPPQPSSEYALEGTAAHKLAELCILGNKDPEDFIGEEINLIDEEQIAEGKKQISYEVSENMAEAVEVYVDYIRKQRGELNIEMRFDLSHIEPGMFGTNDACIYNRQLGILEIVDYKHGFKFVDPEENDQLAYYGIGAAKVYELHPNSTIKLTIVQPRAAGESIKTWTTTVSYLENFTKVLKKGAKATRAKEPKLADGDWCTWCPVFGAFKEDGETLVCTKNYEKGLAVAQAEFADDGAIILPEPETMSAVNLKKVLEFSGTLGSWLKAVNVFAQGMLERGEKVEGYKLVRKKSNRKWNGAEEDIAQKIAAATDVKYHLLYNAPKFKSPAQIEALKIDKNLVATLTVTPDNGNTMAPVEDRRPEVLPSIQSDFSVIEFSE